MDVGLRTRHLCCVRIARGRTRRPRGLKGVPHRWKRVHGWTPGRAMCFRGALCKLNLAKAISSCAP
uniref:Uncharacterized protein n=1 Tax=Setaria viridis TaxID=4556 RepID=A0A4U6WSU3_SETVI|nr:hypothetical protein SEVIR_1G373766v2 [Setaria viridis]